MGAKSSTYKEKMSPLVIKQVPLYQDVVKDEPLELEEIYEERTNKLENFRDILDYHNQIRKDNGLKSLTWDPVLEKRAQEWANILKKENKFRHPDWFKKINCPLNEPGKKGKLLEEVKCFMRDKPEDMNTQGGQNLFISSTSDFKDKSTHEKEAVFSWYDECKIYDPTAFGRACKTDSKRGYVRGSCDQPEKDGCQVGHYTQVVWKDAQKIGCAPVNFSADGRNKNIWVCNYDKGNILGQYTKNIPVSSYTHKCFSKNKCITCEINRDNAKGRGPCFHKKPGDSLSLN